MKEPKVLWRGTITRDKRGDWDTFICDPVMEEGQWCCTCRDKRTCRLHFYSSPLESLRLRKGRKQRIVVMEDK